MLEETRIDKLHRRCGGGRRWWRAVVGTIVARELRLWLLRRVVLLLTGLLHGLQDGLLRVRARLHILLVLLILVVSVRVRVRIAIWVPKLRVLGRGYLRGYLRLDVLAIVCLPRGHRAAKCHCIEQRPSEGLVLRQDDLLIRRNPSWGPTPSLSRKPIRVLVVE